VVNKNVLPDFSADFFFPYKYKLILRILNVKGKSKKKRKDFFIDLGYPITCKPVVFIVVICLLYLCILDTGNAWRAVYGRK